MKLLLYCTKAKPYLRIDNKGAFWTYTNKQLDFPNTILNGKIVAECDFEVEEISSDFHADYDYSIYDYVEFKTGTNSNLELENLSCIDYEEMCEYLGYYEEDKEKVGYAIHVKNLHIFDKPKELNEYLTRAKKMNTFEGYEWVCESIEKAPQNMMYAQDENQNKEYILISIKSEWLCKILNGEKTIEVRKKVLREMLE